MSFAVFVACPLWLLNSSKRWEKSVFNYPLYLLGLLHYPEQFALPSPSNYLGCCSKNDE